MCVMLCDLQRGDEVIIPSYTFVSTALAFLPAEINAAFLWAQLENLDDIQAKRKALWNCYYENLSPLFESPLAPYGERGQGIGAPDIPDYATNNAHMFYLTLLDLETRTALIQHLKNNGVLSVFHYLPLHSSAYYSDKHNGRELPDCDRYADTLVRLPMYYDLSIEDVEDICALIRATSCNKNK